MDTDVVSFFGGSMLAAILFTGLFCRHRVARKKQISYGTTLAGAAFAMLLGITCMTRGGALHGKFMVGR